MPRRTQDLCSNALFDFAYGSITLFGLPSLAVRLSSKTLLCRSSYYPEFTSVWAPPLSLATTYGIDFLSSPAGT